MSRAHGRALWLPDVLRDAGLPVEVVPEFGVAGKEPKEWLAQVNHHTASSPRGGPRPSLPVVREGRPDVPGPLSNTLVDRNGVWVCTSSGAANHPGVSYIPHRGGIASGVKYWTLGHEIELSGVGEPFPVGGRLYESVARGNAAIAIYLGHDVAGDLWDHKAIARPVGRKIDVDPYDLGHGRIYVARLITGTPTPTPIPEDWFTMATEQDLTRVVDAAVAPLREEIRNLRTEGAKRAAVARDPRDQRAWVFDANGRWHVPDRKTLNALIFTGQVQALPDGRTIPVADPAWLDGIPVIEPPTAA